jgi:chromosome segregation ATPase
MLIVQESSSLQAARRELERQQKDSEKSASRASAAQGEARTLAERLSQSEREKDLLQLVVDEHAASVQHLTGKLDAKREELLSLQHQLVEAEDMSRRLRQQASNSDAEVRGLRAEVGGAADALSKANRDASSSRSQAQSLGARLEDAESRLASMQDSLDKRNQEVGLSLLSTRAVHDVGMHRRIH